MFKKSAKLAQLKQHYLEVKSLSDKISEKSQ